MLPAALRRAKRVSKAGTLAGLMPGEDALNRRQNRAKRGLSGEAPVALPLEGVLNPNGCFLAV